jgi:heptaprenylglyceryl phosphate synthase
LRRDLGSGVLLVNGGGIDGGDGAYFANHGADVHVVGSLAPLVPGHFGCM